MTANPAYLELPEPIIDQSLESIDQPCLLHLLVFVDLGHPDFVLETCSLSCDGQT